MRWVQSLFGRRSGDRAAPLRGSDFERREQELRFRLERLAREVEVVQRDPRPEDPER